MLFSIVGIPENVFQIFNGSYNNFKKTLLIPMCLYIILLCLIKIRLKVKIEKHFSQEKYIYKI